MLGLTILGIYLIGCLFSLLDCLVTKEIIISKILFWPYLFVKDMYQEIKESEIKWK